MRHKTFAVPDPFPGIPKPHKAPAREIIDRVAAWHGVTRDTILGRSRRYPDVAARFDAVAAVKIAYPHQSMGWIGRIFRRDHSTIYYALRKRGLK